MKKKRLEGGIIWDESDFAIKSKLYNIIRLQGDKDGLLATIGSWRETVPNDITLSFLEKIEFRLSHNT